MYRCKSIKSKISEAKQNNEKVVVVGDFNAKIGKHIHGNTDEISKSGKILLEMCIENEMTIVNKLNKNRQNIWTRIENNQKSIIDYALVFQENENFVDEVIIDSEKKATPYRKVRDRSIYTDHCAIMMKINFFMSNCYEKRLENRNATIINEKGLKCFEKLTSGNKLQNIANREEDINTKYKAWQTEIDSMIKKSFSHKKTKQKKGSKMIRKLIQYKKKMKRLQTRQTKNINRTKRKIVDEMIKKEKEKSNSAFVQKQLNKLSINGKLKSDAFWKFKKKMDKKKELPSAMIDENGKESCDREKILQIYKQFYMKLFEENTLEDEIEIKSNEITELAFRYIIKNGESSKIITEVPKQNIKKSLQKMKNKSTMDTNSISNKIIKRGGNDLIESLKNIFNQINKTTIPPTLWDNMEINSISKGKGDKKSMEARRGLFITSTVSKLFEKVKIDRKSEDIEKGVSKFQAGGMKGKSTIDNIMTVNATVDYNMFIGSKTYLFFADAYKCFDKIGLKESIVDLSEILDKKEAKIIYEMNKIGKANINTPHGTVGPITLREKVRQGTVFGPVLCSINTDKVNKVGNKCFTTIGPTIKCESLIFVDDIEQTGSHIETIERAVGNCRSMELLRKFTFNNKPDKTCYMIINPKNNNKKCIEEVKTKLKWGGIQQVKEYKYLGEWINENGDNSTKIKKKGEKIK